MIQSPPGRSNDMNPRTTAAVGQTKDTHVPPATSYLPSRMFVNGFQLFTLVKHSRPGLKWMRGKALRHGRWICFYLVFQGAQGICGAAGETSGPQDWRALPSSPSVQRGQRSAMKLSVYGQSARTWSTVIIQSVQGEMWHITYHPSYLL